MSSERSSSSASFAGAATAGTATKGGVTFTGAASTSYDIEGSISSFSMIFGPSFDFDFNNQTEFILGGGIGFSDQCIGSIQLYMCIDHIVD